MANSSDIPDTSYLPLSDALELNQHRLCTGAERLSQADDLILRSSQKRGRDFLRLPLHFTTSTKRQIEKSFTIPMLHVQMIARVHKGVVRFRLVQEPAQEIPVHMRIHN